MKESKVSARQLVEAGEDPTVLLDLADEALHQAPFWVKMRIIRVWLSAPRAAVSREAPHSGLPPRASDQSRTRGLRSYTHS